MHTVNSLVTQISIQMLIGKNKNVSVTILIKHEKHVLVIYLTQSINLVAFNYLFRYPIIALFR